MRPLLEVRLESSRGAPVSTKLLVDSGSEYTLVTGAFARRLGIQDLLSRDHSDTVLMGGQQLLAELHPATLTIGSFAPYEAVIGFVRNWNFVHSGILGQRGFFDRFGVLFDRVNARFGLVDHEHWDEEFPPPPAGP